MIWWNESKRCKEERDLLFRRKKEKGTYTALGVERERKEGYASAWRKVGRKENHVGTEWVLNEKHKIAEFISDCGKFFTHTHITHMCDTGSVIIDKARAEAVHTKRYFQLRWMSSLYGVCLHYVSYSNNIKNQLGIWCISQKRARVKCLDVSFAFCAVECAYYGILFEVINQYIANAYILQFNWNSGCWVKHSIPPASYELSSLFTDFHRNITFVLQLYSSIVYLFQFHICVCSVYFIQHMLSALQTNTGPFKSHNCWNGHGAENRNPNRMVLHFRSCNFGGDERLNIYWMRPPDNN